MALQDLIRKLLPRDDYFYDYIEQLGQLGYGAAVALREFKTKPASEVQIAVQAIEHKADDVVRQMEEALAKTFVTPIDREDLHRLTSELDDIIDISNLAARAFSLYHVEKPTEAMLDLIERLIECTSIIRDAVPLLRKHQSEGLIDMGRKVRALEKKADDTYRKEISRLFSAQQIDFRDLLKQKEALDDLERAVDHCDNVADLLANLAVKNG